MESWSAAYKVSPKAHRPMSSWKPPMALLAFIPANGPWYPDRIQISLGRQVAMARRSPERAARPATRGANPGGRSETRSKPGLTSFSSGVAQDSEIHPASVTKIVDRADRECIND